MRVLSFVKKEEYKSILKDAGMRSEIETDFEQCSNTFCVVSENYNLIFVEIPNDGEAAFAIVKQILDRNPAVNIILLMEECRFEYSMRAMRMGVKNILVGSEINAETVCEVIRNYQKEYADESAFKRENIRRIFEQLIFIHDDGQNNQNAQRLNDVFDLKRNGGCFFVLACSSLEFVLKQNHSNALERKIRCEKISMYLSDFEEKDNAARFVFYLDDIFYIVVTAVYQPSVRRMTQYTREFMERFREYSKAVIGEKSFILSSGCRTDFCDFKKSLSELERLIQISHMLPYSSLALYSDFRFGEPHGEVFEKLTEFAVKMFDSIEKNNGYIDALHKIFGTDMLKNLSGSEFKKFREYLHFEFEFLKKKIDPTDRKFYEAKLEELLLPVNDQYVQDTVLSLAKMLTDSKKSKYNYLITKCMQFISENYMTNIGLYEVAKKLEISTVYLSQLFKKEVGKNFNTYLNEYRLEQSKILIDSGNYKLNRICEMVGFNNLQYFSKCFKKAYQMTPNEYKNRRKSD